VKTSRDRMNAIRCDDVELTAQLVNVLNDLQTTNERCRAALIDGRLADLHTMAEHIVDRAVSLGMLAQT